MSKSITEFWRRWHISLGPGFREYVYIPLGGNRRGLPCSCETFSLCGMLTGIWHGASWNFVVWGVYFGILLAVEKLFLLKILQRIPAFFAHAYTMLLVIISWAIFAFDSLPQGIRFIGSMFSAHNAPPADGTTLYLLLTNGLLLLLGAVVSTDYPKRAAKRISKALARKPALLTTGACAVLFGLWVLCVAYLIDASYNPFLYFRF